MPRLKTSNRVQWIVALGLTVALAAVAGYYALPRAKLTDGKPKDRIAAIREMTAKRPPGAAKELAQAATDPLPEIRRVALAGLSHFEGHEHRAVVEKAIRDPDKRVRAVAANTLGTFDDRSAANVLAKLIETDREEVKLAALRGLAECDDPKAIVTLLETAADKGKSGAVKILAMKGLMRKFNAKLSKNHDPEKDERGWRDLIQRWKRFDRVREAYKAAGVQLVDRPRDIIPGEDYHPERRR